MKITTGFRYLSKLWDAQHQLSTSCVTGKTRSQIVFLKINFNGTCRVTAPVILGGNQSLEAQLQEAIEENTRLRMSTLGSDSQILQCLTESKQVQHEMLFALNEMKELQRNTVLKSTKVRLPWN